MNANAVVLKEISVKDEDKIVVAFSKEYGKISMYAKEGKKIKSPFLAGTQFLTYSNFYIHKKDNLSTIKRIDIKDSFIDIKNDITKLYLTMYFAEFIDALIIEDNPVKEMFNFFIDTLNVLKKSKKINVRLLKSIFELKMLSLAGYMPNVLTCQVCGQEVNDDAYFDVNMDGIVCLPCNIKKHGIKLSKTTIYTLKYIIYAETEKLYKFCIDDKYLDELSKVTDKFKESIIEKTLKTEKFIIYE